MIEETARVVQVQGQRVWISAIERSACGGCAQGGCSTRVLAKMLPRRELEVDSEMPLSPGDLVVVGIDEGALLKGSLMLYIFPLLSLFFGAALTQVLAQSLDSGSGEAWAVVGAAIGLFASLLVLRLWLNTWGIAHVARPVVLRKL